VAACRVFCKKSLKTTGLFGSSGRTPLRANIAGLGYHAE